MQRNCNLSFAEQLEAQNEPWTCRLGGKGEPLGSREWRRGLCQGKEVQLWASSSPSPPPLGTPYHPHPTPVYLLEEPLVSPSQGNLGSATSWASSVRRGDRQVVVSHGSLRPRAGDEV